MKDSKIYLQAARVVHKRNDYSCNVVDRLQPGAYKSQARSAYASMMLGNETSRDVTRLWDMNGQDERNGTHNAKDLRVMLLLMMAAVTEYDEKNG